MSKELKMKSFFEIPLIKGDPATALLIEEGLPECVRMDDYDGMRSMTEVLSKSVPASEVLELREIAASLSLGHVRVLRVTSSASESRVFSPNVFQCLAEKAITLFAICNLDGLVAEVPSAIAERFVLLATLDQTSDEARWQQLAFYTAAIRQCGLNFKMPPWLVSREAVLIADPRTWWGFPVAASTRQAQAFAAYVAEHSGRWVDIAGVIRNAHRWIDAREDEFEGFDQMFNAFQINKPLGPGKALTA